MRDQARLANAVRRRHAEERRHRSRPRGSNELRAIARSGRATAAAARTVRERWRRSGDPAAAPRRQAIERALRDLELAMVPLKQELGRLPHDPTREERWGDELRAAARAITTERRKLWKMSRPR